VPNAAQGFVSNRTDRWFRLRLIDTAARPGQQSKFCLCVRQRTEPHAHTAYFRAAISDGRKFVWLRDIFQSIKKEFS
jgi:hypothetical protein